MPTAGWLRRPDLPLDAAGRSYIDAPSLDQILDQFVNWRGDVNAGGFKLVGYGQSTPGNIEVGAGVPGNRNAWIDLIGDDTYTDFGLRIIRNAEGPNATSDLIHRGTGELRMISNESAPISMFMGTTKIFNFASNGIQFPDGTIQASAGVPATRQIIAGTGLTGGGNLTADRTLSVVNDTTIQKVIAGANGTQSGQRAWINFIAGANVVLSAADEPAQNRVNITINSTGGGTGGSQTPWLSDINAAGFNLNYPAKIVFNRAGATAWDAVGVHLQIDGTTYAKIGVINTGYLQTTGVVVDGAVGIGTTAPDAQLTIANPMARIGNVVGDQVRPFKAIVHDNSSYDSNLQLLGKRHTAGTDWVGFGLRLQHGVQTTLMSYMEFNAAGPAAGCAIGYGATEYMRIGALGNVGIGAAAPVARLHVAGTSTDPNLSADTAAVYFGYSSSIGLAFGSYPASPYSAWIQTKRTTNTGTPDYLAINPLGGNVGIHTAAPTNVLTVNETQADIQDPAVPPLVAGWRRGLIVHGVMNSLDGACIQMGAAGGLGWAIKQICYAGNEGALSIYGALNVDAKMHEMVRFSANSAAKILIKEDALGGGDVTQGPRIMFDWAASGGAPKAAIGISNNGGQGTIRTFNDTGTGYAIFESNLIYIRNAAAPSLQLDGMNSTWATLQWEPSSGVFSISTVWASVGKSPLYITGDGNVYLPFVNTVAGSAGSGKLYRSGNQLLIS